MDKREVEHLMKRINLILNEWDFIGVAQAGPQDEYDCMVGPLATLVNKKASRDEMRKYILSELIDHFGVNEYSEQDLGRVLDELISLDSKS